MSKNKTQVVVAKGARVNGTVEEVRPFGAIVRFDGGSGLLHVSRLAGGSRRSRDRRLSRLEPGEAVVVDVSDVQGGKTSLSELYRDDAVIKELKEGSEVTGTVVHKLDFALIVSIDAGVAAGYDGFVHASELAGADRKTRDERHAFANIGESVTLAVLHVGRDDKGDLSLKLSEGLVVVRRKLATSFAVGSVHTGSVVRVTQDGYVVSFGEFCGLLPQSELGGAKPGSVRIGGNVKTKVLAVDERLNITLTRKGL